MEDYSVFLVKQYTYWGVYVHENQSYLGRCVIWCDRAGALDLTDATEEERSELFFIIRQLKTASEHAFGGDWFNYAFLGNETRHLHGHFIPRYASEKQFAGATFADALWGHNYKTDKQFTVTPEVLEEIRQTMEKQLSEIEPSIVSNR